jgi:hypothetical protein
LISSGARSVSPSSAAVTFGDSKENALYFDQIMVLSPFLDCVSEIGVDYFWSVVDRGFGNDAAIKAFIEDELHPTVAKFIDMAPPALRVRKNYTDLMLGFERVGRSRMGKYGYAPTTRRSVVAALGAMAKEGDREIFFSPNASREMWIARRAGDFNLLLGELKIADVSKISLDHVLEFRKDKDAQAKLRRLRLFALQNYTGKSVDYMRDDILLRISDYEDTCKQWGFETKLSVFSSLLSSKIVQASALLSAAGAILGHAALPIATLAVSVVAQAGKSAVDLARERSAHGDKMRQDPVAFLVTARDFVARSATGS